MQIGQVLRDTRVEKGILISQLEDKLCLTKSAISKLETGKNRLSDMGLIVRWAEALQSREPLKSTCNMCPVFTALYSPCKPKKARLN